MPPLRRQPRRPVPAPTAQLFQIPAPVGGLNTVDAGLAMPATDCVSAYNLYAAENGLAVRMGEREWALGMSSQVRTTVAFLGASNAKCFSAHSEGIYDVTESRDDVSTGDASFVAFPSTAGDAGYGVSTTFVTAAGHYLLYADEENGLYRYSEVGATWTKVAAGGGAGEISGLDPTKIVFVMSFANRLWFVERDTASAWYLPAGQIAGTATEFPMGTRFSHGGSLVGLWEWTYDGGGGLGAALVALSSGGDVLVYQGTDPDSAETFGLKGTWYAGPPPAGRTVASTFGGELLLLTRQGLLPMSKLVVGLPDARAEALTAKVSNLVAALMTERASYKGWQVVQHPEAPILMILCPQGTGLEPLQLVQSVGTKGWFLWRGLAMSSACVFDKQLFYGTTDNPGRVCVNTGYVDGVVLADASAFTPIQWSLLTAFSDLGIPRQKQIGLIRPLILSDGAAPSFTVEARYKYDQSEVDPVALVAGGSSTWGSSAWDGSTWGGSYAPTQEMRGAAGMGTAVGVAIRGTAVARTVLVAMDVSFTSGGFL